MPRVISSGFDEATHSKTAFPSERERSSRASALNATDWPPSPETARSALVSRRSGHCASAAIPGTVQQSFLSDLSRIIKQLTKPDTLTIHRHRRSTEMESGNLCLGQSKIQARIIRLGARISERGVLSREQLTYD